MKLKSTFSGLDPVAFALAFGAMFAIQLSTGYYTGYVLGFIDSILGPSLLSAVLGFAFVFANGAFFGLLVAWLYNKLRESFSKR